MARTMKEKALYIEEQKQKMYDEFIKVGFTPEEITTKLANYPNLISALEFPRPIAIWSGEGRRNDEPESTRNILPDLSGNGHHITLNNFAFSKDSGYGKYDLDFTDAIIPSVNTIENVSPYVKIIKNVGTQEPKNLFFKKFIGSGGKEQKMNVNINGLSASQGISLYYDGGTLITLNNGKNEIKFTPNNPDSFIGFRANFSGICDIKIDLLPTEYENAIVFDGVDDYGICDNMPIFTKEKGYTVIAERIITKEDGGYLCGKSNGVADQSAFYFESAKYKSVLSFGGTTNNIYIPMEITWSTSSIANGNPINKGKGVDSGNTFTIGSYISNGSKFGGGLYSLHIFDHDLTPSAIETYIRRNINPAYTLPQNQ